jgi:hypothetical protein
MPVFNAFIAISCSNSYLFPKSGALDIIWSIHLFFYFKLFCSPCRSFSESFMYFNIPSTPVIDTCIPYSSFNYSKVFFLDVRSLFRLVRASVKVLELTAFTIDDLNCCFVIGSAFYFLCALT